jgi:hypothetical protein
VSVAKIKNAEIFDSNSPGEGLLTWGSSHFAASEVYLAYIPADQIENPNAHEQGY